MPRENYCAYCRRETLIAYGGRHLLGKIIVPIVEERQSLHMEEGTY